MKKAQIEVKYEDHMGSDLSVVNAARQSFAKQETVFDETTDGGLIQFLAAEFLGKDRIQVFCFQRLLGAGVKRWHGLVHHIGLYVIPVLWDFLFRENESFLFVAHSG